MPTHKDLPPIPPPVVLKVDNREAWYGELKGQKKESTLIASHRLILCLAGWISVLGSVLAYWRDGGLASYVFMALALLLFARAGWANED